MKTLNLQKVMKTVVTDKTHPPSPRVTPTSPTSAKVLNTLDSDENQVPSSVSDENSGDGQNPPPSPIVMKTPEHDENRPLKGDEKRGDELNSPTSAKVLNTLDGDKNQVPSSAGDENSGDQTKTTYLTNSYGNKQTNRAQLHLK